MESASFEKLNRVCAILHHNEQLPVSMRQCHSRSTSGVFDPFSLDDNQPRVLIEDWPRRSSGAHIEPIAALVGFRVTGNAVATSVNKKRTLM